jgi:dipeptidyl aminopeptidase/acylaminoacyl peptidase
MSVFATALLLFLVAGMAGGADRKLLTPEAIVARSVQTVAMRLDGNAIVYVVNEPVSDEQSQLGGNPELWWSSIDGKSGKRYTDNSGVDASPQWSPDGTSIAFLSNRPGDNGTQIYILSANGDGLRRLTANRSPVAAFAWAPDGKRIAYLAAEPLTAAQKARRAIFDDEEVLSISDIERHGIPQKLWVLDTVTGQSRLIAAGYHVTALAWSPDGTKLLTKVADAADNDHEWTASRLAVIDDVKGGKPRTYCATQGKLDKAKWRPDGRAISFLGAAERREPAPSSLYICLGEGSTPVNLTAGKPFTVVGQTWLPDGHTALVTIVEKNSRYLARYDFNTREFSRVSPPGQIVSPDISLSQDGQKLALAIETPTRPADVWTGMVKGPLQRVTRLNPALEELTYGDAEDVSWNAQDGLEITGILVKPADYQPGHRYPMIVWAHGGPEGVDLNGFQIAWGQLFAAHGYAVLLPNFRGSTGRGASYTLEDNRDFGGKDFLDVMSGVDEMIRRGIADPNRLGIGGWSYGGYMSAWAAAQTDRFKASVMGAGVSSWFALMGQTPMPLWTVQVHFETWPSDNPAAFRKNSPIEFVKNVRTPVLILHGEADPDDRAVSG